MTKSIIFDTLDYATTLRRHGIEFADEHSSSLAKVISQNIYSKMEIDKMIEDAIRENREARDKSIAQLEDKMRTMYEKLSEQANKNASRNFYLTITILGGLMTIYTGLGAFIHTFVH